MKTTLLFMLFAACATDDPSVDLDSLPTCANLGCPDAEVTDKACAERSECFCTIASGTKLQCAPGPLRCREIGCNPPDTIGSSCPSHDLCSCPSPDGRPISVTCAP